MFRCRSSKIFWDSYWILTENSCLKLEPKHENKKPRGWINRNIKMNYLISRLRVSFSVILDKHIYNFVVESLNFNHSLPNVKCQGKLQRIKTQNRGKLAGDRNKSKHPDFFSKIFLLYEPKTSELTFSFISGPKRSRVPRETESLETRMRSGRILPGLFSHKMSKMTIFDHKHFKK